MKTSSTSHLKMQSFHLSEEIRRVETELKKLRESLNRNRTNNDTVLIKQIQNKIQIKEKELHQLQSQDSKIGHEQKSRKSNEKSRIF